METDSRNNATPEIRDTSTTDLADRKQLNAVETGAAIYRVVRYGQAIGYLVPAAWFDEHQGRP